MSDSEQILFDKVDKMECPSCHSDVDVSALEAFSAAACPRCGAALTVPARLAHYRLVSCLGSGGMGSVYRAYDETLARVVAIKVMLRKLGDQPEFLESFRREAQAAAKLNHPNIAQIYSFGQEKGQPYIVMELVPGKHFDKMIESPDPLPQPMVMKIGMDIADGLQLAAASSLIHGDIKPENILLDDRNVAKLVDFGIASTPDSGSNEIWGTPYYISPEKIKREKVDYRSDIYCLGGTLYHAITKHPPFDGRDALEVVKARLVGPPRPMGDFRPDVDKEVEEIILRMLQLDPAMRYPTYGSLMSDIRQYLARVQPQHITSASNASKRIVIKGRSAATRARMQAAATTGLLGGDAVSPGTTGLVATGRKGALRIGRSRKGSGPEAAPEPVEEVDPVVEAQRRAKAVKKILYSIAASVFFFIAAIVGAFLLVKSHARKAEARRAALVDSQRDALAPLYAICGKALQTRDGLVAEAVEKAGEMVRQAVSAVEAECGTAFTARIAEEVPDKEEAPGGGDGKAAAEGDPAREAPPEGGAPAEAPTGGGAPPEGIAAGGAELEGLPAAAREIFVMLAPVRKAKRLADGACESLSALCARAAGSTNVASATLSGAEAEVAANLGAIDSLREEAARAGASLAQAVESLPAALKGAQAKLDGLMAETKKLAAERERVAAEEKAAVEARVAAEREAAEEAARQAAEEGELAKARAIVPGSYEKLLAHQYDSVLRELDRVGKELSSKTAQKALKSEIRRVEGLRDLKAFLVQRLGGDDKFVHPKIKWSVVSADERNLEIRPAKRGAPSQRVSWGQMKPLDQVVPVIMYYLGDEEKVRDLGLRERAACYINAAVYFMVFSGESESAKAAARRFGEQAMAIMPSKKNEVVETLYDIVFDDE